VIKGEPGFRHPQVSPTWQELSLSVVLDRHEFGELLELLKEPRWPEELESFTGLRDETAAELSLDPPIS
jgi:hypothetical protein